MDDPSTPDVNEGNAPEFGTEADFAPFRGVSRLSRFKLKGDKLDLASEQQIIDVPADRGICCHMGGQIDFDKQGNLYLSTGDDTNPFQSDGYTPIDERPDRNPAFDAQRTSANTNDLRGKLLRIRVKTHGGYTVPKGNLFARGTPKTKPEIYVMGFRNPFRFAVNRENGDIYLADYSPDNPEPEPAARPGRPRQVDGPARAGQLRLAVLRHRRAALCRLRLRHRPVRRDLRLRQPGERVAEQHRPAQAAADDAARGLVPRHPVARVPGARHGRRRPDGRSRLRLQPARAARGTSGRSTTTACRSSSSGPATT